MQRQHGRGHPSHQRSHKRRGTSQPQSSQRQSSRHNTSMATMITAGQSHRRMMTSSSPSFPSSPSFTRRITGSSSRESSQTRCPSPPATLQRRGLATGTPSSSPTITMQHHPPITTPPAAKSPLEVYNDTVKAGTLASDPRQLATIQQLDTLWHDINALPREVVQRMSTMDTTTTAHDSTIRRMPTAASSSPTSPSGAGGGLSTLWNTFKTISKALPVPSSETTTTSSNTPTTTTTSRSHHPRPHSIRGYYIYGGVGCGKTMMMDMFFDAVPPTRIKKVRKHFHSFMLDVHKHLHRLRQQAKETGVTHTDPLIHIARQFVAREGQLLCLDEFQVTDVADAMILKELFSALFDHGCIVVSTSNRPPEDLYKNGINRDSFLPFIDILKDNCRVIAMDNMQDYRLRVTMEEGVFHIPLSQQTRDEMETIYQRLAAGSPSQVYPLAVQMGRTLTVDHCVPKRVARFQFTDLCAKALGAADYMAIAKEFPCILVENVPVLYFDLNREMIRRFITMLDVFYEHRSKVFMSLEAHPSELFKASSTASSSSSSPGDKNGQQPTGREDEIFASARAVSRLIEMSSTSYLEGPLHTAGSKDTEATLV